MSLLPLALSRFSESILDYLANLDKAPDPTVRKDTFSSEIYAAYDILFNSWLQSRDAKVQEIRQSKKPISANSISCLRLSELVWEKVSDLRGRLWCKFYFP